MNLYKVWETIISGGTKSQTKDHFVLASSHYHAAYRIAFGTPSIALKKELLAIVGDTCQFKLVEDGSTVSLYMVEMLGQTAEVLVGN